MCRNMFTQQLRTKIAKQISFPESVWFISQLVENAASDQRLLKYFPFNLNSSLMQTLDQPDEYL